MRKKKDGFYMFEKWVDDIVERTKDNEITKKNAEICHKFAVKCHTLYPSNNK